MASRRKLQHAPKPKAAPVKPFVATAGLAHPVATPPDLALTPVSQSAAALIRRADELAGFTRGLAIESAMRTDGCSAETHLYLPDQQAWATRESVTAFAAWQRQQQGGR